MSAHARAGEPPMWAKVLFRAGTALGVLLLLGLLPSKTGDPSSAPDAQAAFLIPGLLYLLAIPGFLGREHRVLLLILSTAGVAMLGAGLAWVYPEADAALRLLTLPFAFALLGWAGRIASPAGRETPARWAAMLGALLFGVAVLAFALGLA